MPAAPSHLYSVPAYVVAGGIATGAHYATTIASVELAEITPLAGSCMGFCIGALVKYALNYSIAFRSEHGHAATGARFVAVLALMFAGNAAVFWVLNTQLGLNYVIAQVITTVVLIAPGYIVNRRWVFVRC
jgi:putative flippase GtrA